MGAIWYEIKDIYRVSIEFYIIAQVILAFWLVLAYDCLRYYVKLIWESPTTEDTNFHRHQSSFN